MKPEVLQLTQWVRREHKAALEQADQVTRVRVLRAIQHAEQAELALHRALEGLKRQVG